MDRVGVLEPRSRHAFGAPLLGRSVERVILDEVNVPVLWMSNTHAREPARVLVWSFVLSRLIAGCLVLCRASSRNHEVMWLFVG
jgi:RsiW-degrading membrane proteinase PrsW (M82 family)